jgi:hypothetical protein
MERERSPVPAEPDRGSPPPAAPAPPSAASLLALQRSAGNRAVAARIAATRGAAQISRWPNWLDDKIEELRGTTPPDLDNVTLAAVAPARIARMTGIAFARFTGAQLGVLTAPQVAALTAAQLGGLTGAQGAAVAPAFLDNLPRPLLQHLPAAFLTGLPAARFGQFSPADLDLMTAPQLGALQRSQLNGLGYERVAQLSALALSRIQLGQLPDRHVSALTFAQLTGLGANVAQFAVTQIPHFTTPQLHSLTDAQVSALTQPQVAALNAAELHALMPRLPAHLAAAHPVLLQPPPPVPVTTPIEGTLTGPGVRLPEFKERTVLDVQNALPATIAALTEQDISEFTSQHVAAISAAQAPSLPGNLMRTFPAAHIGALQPATFAALGTVRRNFFTVEQIHNVVAAQVADPPLPTAELRALSPALIAALLPAQIASFDDGFTHRLSADQRAALTPSQFGAQRPQQLNPHSGAHIAVLTPAQVAAVPPAQITDLITTQHKFNSLTVAQLNALTNDHLAALPAAWRTAHPLAPDLAAANAPHVLNVGPASTVAEIQALPLDQIRGLAAPIVQGFTPLQIGAFSPVQIPALPAAGVHPWAAPQVQALANRVRHLSLEQLRGMNGALLTQAQVGQLAPEQLAAVPPLGGQAAHLAANQIEALMPAQVDAMFLSLSLAAITAVTPAQIPAISQANLANVPQLQLRAMTRHQFAALQDPQIATLANTRIEDITPAQFGWLAPRVRTEMVPTIAHGVAARVGLAEFQIDPLLIAALPAPLRALVPPSGNAAAPIATRKEALWALMPDRRRQALSARPLPALGPPPAPLVAMPPGWNNLVNALAALHPAFSVMVAPGAAPDALSAMFSIPGITMAQAVRTAVTGAVNSLQPLFASTFHHNWNSNLPGPTSVRQPGPPNAPVIPGSQPYMEFDIYPDPGVVGGGVPRGVHRILLGIPITAGPLMAAPHPGLNRWFYTPDHYHTMIPI